MQREFRPIAHVGDLRRSVRRTESDRDSLGSPKLLLAVTVLNNVTAKWDQCVRGPNLTSLATLRGKDVHQIAHHRVGQTIADEKNAKHAKHFDYKTSGPSVTQISVTEIACGEYEIRMGGIVVTNTAV